MLALQAAEEEEVAGPCGGEEDGGEPDGGEAGDEGSGGVVGEEAEDGGCGKDHHRHEVEEEGEAGQIPQNRGPAGETAGGGEIGKRQGRKAGEDVEVAAGPRHLLGDEAGEVAAVEEEFHGQAEGLEADEPGDGGRAGKAGAERGDGDGGGDAKGNQDEPADGGVVAGEVAQQIQVSEGAGERHPAEGHQDENAHAARGTPAAAAILRM